MATESQVVAAVLAAVNAALPATVRAYEPSKVPGSRPAEFVQVTVVRRSGGTARAGRRSTRGWAVYFMAASRTSEANARNSLRLAGDALENRALIVGDESSTPVEFNTARPVSPDDGWFSGSSVYHFAI